MDATARSSLRVVVLTCSADVDIARCNLRALPADLDTPKDSLHAERELAHAQRHHDEVRAPGQKSMHTVLFPHVGADEDHRDPSGVLKVPVDLKPGAIGQRPRKDDEIEMHSSRERQPIDAGTRLEARVASCFVEVVAKRLVEAKVTFDDQDARHRGS
jgi:hypothetical protein